MGKKKDYYEILGVPKAATAGDINEAYHKQSALKWKEAERGFERLTTAYKVLSDPLRRPFYDMHLRAEEKLMGKVRPPAASSRGSTGVARGTEVGTGRTSREVAGTGGRKNTDRTGRGAKRAGLGSSTGKAGGENGKRPRGPTDGTTCATGAGLGGATGARASTAFFPTGHSTFETAVKYTNEYYDEEVNCASEDDGEPFCPTDHSTFKTAVKTMNEYYDEDENLGLCMYEDGDEEEGVQGDYGKHAGAGNDDTVVCDDLFNGDDEEGGAQYAEDDDGGRGDHNYGDHAGAGNNDDTGVCDDRFNGDDYYDDAAGGLDDGYYDGDGGDGADDWW